MQYPYAAALNAYGCRSISGKLWYTTRAFGKSFTSWSIVPCASLQCGHCMSENSTSIRSLLVAPRVAPSARACSIFRRSANGVAPNGTTTSPATACLPSGVTKNAVGCTLEFGALSDTKTTTFVTFRTTFSSPSIPEPPAVAYTRSAPPAVRPTSPAQRQHPAPPQSAPPSNTAPHTPPG